MNLKAALAIHRSNNFQELKNEATTILSYHQRYVENKLGNLNSTFEKLNSLKHGLKESK